MLRARASLVISAKRSSGILSVIVLTEGRYCASGRMAIPGSYLTAVITSLVLEPAKEATDPILAKLDKFEEEIARLRSHLEKI
jgi:hypothetical protein